MADSAIAFFNASRPASRNAPLSTCDGGRSPLAGIGVPSETIATGEGRADAAGVTIHRTTVRQPAWCEGWVMRLNVFCRTVSHPSSGDPRRQGLTKIQKQASSQPAPVENQPVSEIIRAAISTHIESRRRDPKLQTGLKDRIDRARRLLKE